MRTVVYDIPGRPVAYQRVAVWQGRRLTPTRSRAYSKTVALCTMQAFGGLDWNRTARMRVTVEVTPQDRRRSDVDNFGKSILDGITKSGVVWVDDWQVDDLRVVRMEPSKTSPRVRVCVEALS